MDATAPDDATEIVEATTRWIVLERRFKNKGPCEIIQCLPTLNVEREAMRTSSSSVAEEAAALFFCESLDMIQKVKLVSG